MKEKNKNKQKNNCDLPDVLEFLNLSRTIIRQMNLLKKTNINEEHIQLTANAAVSVADEALRFAERYV